MPKEFADLESPTVQAEVNPPNAKLGDLIKLSVRVTHPQALRVENLELPKTIGTFEVYGSTRLPAVVGDDKAMDVFETALQNFTTGQQLLPAIEIPYTDPMGKRHSVKTASFTVTIEEEPAGPHDKGDIRGFKGVIGPTAWSPWWWLVAVFLVSGLAFLLWYKRKRALAGPPPPPPIPADITALRKLEELSRTDWLASGKTKEFYSAVSDILRAYVEQGFATPALERTTYELMRDLRKQTKIAMERQGEFRTILETCDLVKFAKFRPDLDEGRLLHAAAVKFVERTRDQTSSPAGSVGGSI